MTRCLYPALGALACTILASCSGAVTAPEAAAWTPAAILALPAPEGIDGALWGKLTARLAEELEQVQGSRFKVQGEERQQQGSAATPGEGRRPAAPTKSASAAGDPPSGPIASAQVAYDSPSARLSWYYTAPGDYDQNGEVNAGDLLPLATHFGMVSPGGIGTPWPLGAVEAQIDGDGNGQIGLTDVTPIGLHWKERVEGYHAYRAADVAAYPPGPKSV